MCPNPFPINKDAIDAWTNSPATIANTAAAADANTAAADASLMEQEGHEYW